MNTKQLFGTVLDTTLRIVFILIVVMLIYKYAIHAYDFGYKVFAGEALTSEENATRISIAVTEGASVKEIGEVLQEKSLIEDAGLFVVKELLSKYKGEINPGVYELSSAMTAEEMIAVMAAKEAEVSDEPEVGEE